MPTVWAMLHRREQRPARFYVGSRQFDLVDVGLRSVVTEDGTRVGPAAVLSGPMNRASSVEARRVLLGHFDFLGRGFRATCFDGDLHSILHRIFERHLDSEQAVLVDRFGLF
ncbi:MAG TPA: hypothetical protein VGL15_13560, partial [Vicinamibacteria bacterium]